MHVHAQTMCKKGSSQYYEYKNIYLCVAKGHIIGVSTG